jgi:hypothetical protein
VNLYRFVILLGVFTLYIPSTLLYAADPLETETARLLKAGLFQVESTFEYQVSKDGTEFAVPLAFEYGITNNLQILVEPVVFTAIRPKVGPKATGIGDLEVTLFYLFLHEGPVLPALAIAAEVKIPTARNTLIGTGKADYTPFLLISKRFGKFDTHANIGYTIVGEPSGVELKNIFSFALAVEYNLNEKFDIVGEILGNTSSSAVGAENPVAPEATGGTVSGLLGSRYYVRPNFFLSLGVGYDNNNAVLIRPGLTFQFSVR